jgi:DNA invertase Pin-like site-specific DNA recombinase
MISDCENGKINLILTKEVSRFARNTVDTLCFTRKLSSIGVGVIFMNDGIDTRDKDGELRLTIMASIAQEESRKVSERVKWGIRRKMENGFVYGYSHMLGYKTENGKHSHTSRKIYP